MLDTAAGRLVAQLEAAHASGVDVTDGLLALASLVDLADQLSSLVAGLASDPSHPL